MRGWLVVLIACGPTLPSESVQPPSSDVPLRRSETSLWIDVEPPSSAMDEGRARLVGLDAEGTAHFLLGDLRATTSRDGRVELASAFAGPVDHAERCGRGWVFSGSGVLAHTSSFTGELERLADSAGALRGNGVDHVVRANGDELVEIFCEGAQAELTATHVPGLIAAASTRTTLVVAAEDGLFARWRGDSSPRRIDLGQDTVVALGASSADGVVIETTDGPRVLREGERSLRDPGWTPEVPRLDPERAPADARRISEAFEARGGRLRGMYVPDGRYVAIRDRTLHLDVDDRHLALPVPRHDCRPFAWAGEPAFRCGREVYRVYVGPDGIESESLGELPNHRTTSPAVEDTFFVSGRGGPPAWLNLRSGEEIALDVSSHGRARAVGGTVLLETSGAWHGARLSHPELRRLPSPIDASRALVTVAPDGSVWGIPSTSEISEIYEVVGDHTVPHALPEGTRHVRVLGRGRLLAAGRTIRTTREWDGERWTPVEVDAAIDGDLAFSDEDRATLESCDGICSIHPAHVGRRPRGGFRGALLAQHEVPADTAPVERSEDSDEYEERRCELVRERPGLARHDARLAVDASAIRWTGIDASGEYTSRATPPRSFRVESCSAHARARRHVAFTCSIPDDGTRVLYWAVADGSVERIVNVRGVPTILLTPDEGAVAVLATDDDPGLTHAIAWDGAGRVEHHRRFYRLDGVERDASTHPAWLRGRPAVAVARRDSSALYLLEPADAPRAPEILPFRSAQPCDGPASARSTLVQRPRDAELILHTSGSAGDADTTISSITTRHEGDAVCLHAMRGTEMLHADSFDVSVQTFAPRRTIRVRTNGSPRVQETLEALVDDGAASSCFDEEPGGRVELDLTLGERPTGRVRRSTISDDRAQCVRSNILSSSRYVRGADGTRIRLRLDIGDPPKGSLYSVRCPL